MTQRLYSDRVRRTVVWEMSPDEAQALVEFLRPNTPWRDGFHRDLDRIEELATKLTKPKEFV